MQISGQAQKMFPGTINYYTTRVKILSIRKMCRIDYSYLLNTANSSKPVIDQPI